MCVVCISVSVVVIDRFELCCSIFNVVLLFVVFSVVMMLLMVCLLKVCRFVFFSGVLGCGLFLIWFGLLVLVSWLIRLGYVVFGR